MRCGISTACFFPENTLDSLREVIACGARVTEIFLNTFHELEPEYIAKLCGLVQASDIKVISVHPFSSSMEGFFFATNYAGRFEDGIKLYRRFFEACRALGATKLVFHGDHAGNPAGFSDKRYADNFCRLAHIGQEYGVTLCHENVYYCRLNSPQRVRELKPLLGGHAAFVLDTKQVQRQGASLSDMIDAMAPSIRHVHISDTRPGKDCVPPGTGTVDFAALLDGLLLAGYEGDMLIELYRDGFGDRRELTTAMEYINTLIKARLG